MAGMNLPYLKEHILHNQLALFSKPAWLTAALILALFLTACRYPASTPAPNTPTAQNSFPTPAGLPDGNTPENTSPETQAAPSPPGTAPASGIIVQALDNTLQVVNPGGQAAPLALADRPFNSPLFQYFPSSRFAGGLLYGLSVGDEGLTRAYAIDAGGARLAPFIEQVYQGLAVWPGDGAQPARLAWDVLANIAENNTATSRLFVSNADGSEGRAVLEEAGPGRVLAVGRWSRDGQRLFYSKEPLGLGGYILFGGASNLWAYSLADGSTAELLAEPGAACIDDLSPDETLVAHHCTNTSISIVQIASGTTSTINPPAEGVEANFTGSARFNPDGPQVAFAIARGNPDNEQGWVAVSDGLEGTARLVAAAPAGQYFQVAAWLDPDTLVLQSWGVTPGVWLVNIEGSELRQIAEGVFHGLSQ
jgi:hypothetical protein